MSSTWMRWVCDCGMRKQGVGLCIVTRWHCWSMFGLPGDTKQDGCVLCTATCAPGQHVLPAFIPPPLSLIFLSFSFQPLSPCPYCVCVRVCVCVCVCVCECACECVCVNDDSERSIWHCPKERWWKPEWKAQQSINSDLRWQTLRPQRMIPHMLTVLPCFCVEALGNDTWQGWKCVLHWICSLSVTRCSR